MSALRLSKFLLGAMIATAVGFPQSSLALPAIDEISSPTNFVWLFRTLTAGTPVTIETRNLSGNTTPDPVLHVLFVGGSTPVQVEADDDSGDGLNSKVTFTPATTGSYRIWVHGWDTTRWGNADIFVDGSAVLTQARFGGFRKVLSWSTGENFRMAGTSPGASNDFMIFLNSYTTTYLQHDDDAGPNLYPRVVATSSHSDGFSRAYAGAFPGATTASARLVKDDVLTGGCFIGGPQGNDCDLDGLSFNLENLIGTNALSYDSDNDMVEDAVELYGTDGFSFSEWGTPTNRNLFVEIDHMGSAPFPTDGRAPYSSLPTDVANMFASNSNDAIDVNVFIDQQLTWRRVVTFGTCPSGQDCVPFYTLKSANFSTSSPSRRPYFHYAVWGFKHDDDANCSSGVAELLGNDVIISLGCFANSSTQQLGTFVHELGHNLSLEHNGNGNNNGNNSVIHASVMNYRYQTSGLGRYSHGPSTSCANPSTSPKQECLDCWFFCSDCDCDTDEWSQVTMNFYEGSQYSDGADLSARNLKGEKQNPALLEYVRPEEPLQHRADRAARKIERLVAAGSVEGREFTVSKDRTKVYSVCP